MVFDEAFVDAIQASAHFGSQPDLMPEEILIIRNAFVALMKRFGYDMPCTISGWQIEAFERAVDCCIHRAVDSF
jgi:hypothetical protein